MLPGGAGEEREVTSKPIDGKSVTMDEAAAIARRTVPDGRLVSVCVPDAKDKTSTYNAYLARGNDPYDHGIYPGNVGVAIDRYSGKATVTYPSQANPPLSTQIADDWFYPAPRGDVRERLVAHDLAGLRRDAVLLAVTGVITWLIRRGKRRRKSAVRAGMSESLARTISLYAALLALFSLATAVRGRGLGARTPARRSCSARARCSTRSSRSSASRPASARTSRCRSPATCCCRCSRCRWAGATRARRRAAGTPRSSRWPRRR